MQKKMDKYIFSCNPSKRQSLESHPTAVPLPCLVLTLSLRLLGLHHFKALQSFPHCRIKAQQPGSCQRDVFTFTKNVILFIHQKLLRVKELHCGRTGCWRHSKPRTHQQPLKLWAATLLGRQHPTPRPRGLPKPRGGQLPHLPWRKQLHSYEKASAIFCRVNSRWGNSSPHREERLVWKEGADPVGSGHRYHSGWVRWVRLQSTNFHISKEDGGLLAFLLMNLNTMGSVEREAHISRILLLLQWRFIWK